jgi:hypothetical protein
MGCQVPQRINDKSRCLMAATFGATLTEAFMKLSQRIQVLLLAAAPVLLSGCYPETPDYIEEYDLIYTDRSASFDFQAADTYAIPDSVVLLTGNLQDGELPEKVDAQYGDLIIEQIRDNMNARGWTEVAATADPDVMILPAVNKTTNVNVYYSYGGYWGWYYPYYGYGYGGYYTPSYETGSLFMQMVDPNEVSGTGNVPIVWIGVINGLVEGSQASINARVLTDIDQAFTQSEYLQQ